MVLNQKLFPDFFSELLQPEKVACQGSQVKIFVPETFPYDVLAKEAPLGIVSHQPHSMCC